MKHLLLISYPFPPNQSAGAVRSERFARHLSGFGWQTTVMTIEPNEKGSVQNDDFDKFYAKEHDISIHRTHTIDPWLWMMDKRPRSIILRILRSAMMRIFSFPDHMLLWVPFVVKEVQRLRKKGIQFNAIYTTSPPHSTHLAGLILLHLLNVPWVADFRDPWTLNAYRKNDIINKTLLGIERACEKLIMKQARAILINTKSNLKNLIQAFPNIDKKKLFYLPNGWEEFPEAEPESASDRPFRIVHAGMFYPKFKPYGLLEAIAEWRKGAYADVPSLDDDALKVLLLGSTDDETKRVVSTLGLGGLVEIMPRIPLANAQQRMKEADALWVSLGTGIESSTYVPSKVFEYIAARKPIIGFFHEGDAEEIIRKTKTGTVFTSDDPVPIIRFLHQAMINKTNGQCDYAPDEERVNEFHITHIVKQLSKILETIK